MRLRRRRRRRQCPIRCEPLIILVCSHAFLAGREQRSSCTSALSRPFVSSSSSSSRRSFLLLGTDVTRTTAAASAAATASLALLLPYAATAAQALESRKEDPPLLPPPQDDLVAVVSSTTSSTRTTTFRSLAYGKAEYTNSITASRDTNISPLEAYDVIRQRIPPAAAYTSAGLSAASAAATTTTTTTSLVVPRVLDVGAGAGLSTSILFHELGYRNVDAVDWSDEAWNSNVIEQPNTVHFYALDDDSYFQSLHGQSPDDKHNQTKYQAIVYNFAVNADKASKVAQTYLDPSIECKSVLLAPINDKMDYWYKQRYALYNASGTIVWESDPDVGAWSVQFQPDVTSNTCTGIWCGSYNGFRNQQQQQQSPPPPQSR